LTKVTAVVSTAVNVPAPTFADCPPPVKYLTVKVVL